MVTGKLAWALIPLLGLIELGGHLFFAERAPAPDDWTVIEQDITELARSDDLILVAPYWAEPNARRALGDERMPLPHVARPDVTGFARAVEVSILGAHSPELSGWKVVEERSRPPFLFRLLSNPNHAPLRYQFVDALTPDSASVSHGEKQAACRWNPKARVSNGALDRGHATFPRERFECGGKDWHFAGVTVIEDENYRPRRCIWTRPSASAPLSVTYRQAQLGERIYGYAGAQYFFARAAKRAPMELEVLVDGASVGTYTHQQRRGWTHFEFQLGAHAGGQAEVTFVVRAKKKRSRELCFYADSR